MARFLGFLESYPYRASCELGPELCEAGGVARAGVQPALDLTARLERAAERGRLVVTLPWVVEYLAQLDQAGAGLPWARSAFLALARLYQTRLAPAGPAPHPATASFLSLALGWLFEHRNFPRELLIIASVDPGAALGPSKPAGATQLDSLALVTTGLVAQCCPWAGAVRELLEQGAATPRPGARHITPAPAPPSHPARTSHQLLQAHLEENFFHNQPRSLRRAVEFVAERLASGVTRRVRVAVVPEERTRTAALLPSPGDETGLVALAAASVERVRGEADALLGNPLLADSRAALDLLLAWDTGPAARQTCAAVAARTVREKVEQWLGQQVTVEYFTREYRSELERLARVAARDPQPPIPALPVPPEHAATQPALSAPNPSELLIALKSQTKALLGVGVEDSLVTEESCLARLVEARECVVRGGAAMLPVASRALASLSLDWLLTVIAKVPDAASPAVAGAAVSLWSVLPPPQLPTLLCPRTALLLDRAPALPALARLLAALLTAGLLPGLALEDCWLSLQRAGAATPSLASVLVNVAATTSRQDLDWVAHLASHPQEKWEEEKGEVETEEEDESSSVE